MRSLMRQLGFILIQLTYGAVVTNALALAIVHLLLDILHGSHSHGNECPLNYY